MIEGGDKSKWRKLHFVPDFEMLGMPFAIGTKTFITETKVADIPIDPTDQG